MRMLVKVTIPREIADEAFSSGALSRTMQSAMDKLEPEAAYFFPEDDKRVCLFVFDMNLQAFFEPLFPNLDASIYATPAMDRAEFEQGFGKPSGKKDESEFLADINPVPRKTPQPQARVGWIESLDDEPAEKPAEKRK